MPIALILALLGVIPFDDEPTTVAVIPIVVGPKRELGLSAIGREIGAAAAWRPKVQVIDAEELFVRDPSWSSARLDSCGSDIACVSEALRPFGLSLVILLVVNTEITPAVVALRALDPKRRTIRAEEIGSPLSVKDALRAQAARLFDALGFAESGRLVVRCDSETAEIAIDPTPLDRGTGRRYWVTPGRYRVTARARDRRASAEVTIAAREEREASIVLAEDASVLESPWLWIGVGAGAAAIVATSIVLFVGRGRDLCLGKTPCP
jgi:hypothetical protein